MYSTEQIKLLAGLYAEHRHIELSTLGRLAVGSSSVFPRIEKDKATVRTIKRIVNYLSEHWPADLEWPADIPRPKSPSNRKKRSDTMRPKTLSGRKRK